MPELLLERIVESPAARETRRGHREIRSAQEPAVNKDNPTPVLLTAEAQEVLDIIGRPEVTRAVLEAAQAVPRRESGSNIRK